MSDGLISSDYVHIRNQMRYCVSVFPYLEDKVNNKQTMSHITCNQCQPWAEWTTGALIQQFLIFV